jgi:uncharacterized protein
MAHPLRVNTAELLRRPGTEKVIELGATTAELGVEHPAYRTDARVELQLHLDSMSDGLVVRGSLVVPWHGVCRRCAVEVGGDVHSEVHELYQLTVTDPDAFALPPDQLDLEPMVREVLLIDAPVTPLCRPDCAGLCPVCGADRNTDPCTCTDVVVDHRWDALESLKHQLDD